MAGSETTPLADATLAEYRQLCQARDAVQDGNDQRESHSGAHCAQRDDPYAFTCCHPEAGRPQHDVFSDYEPGGVTQTEQGGR